MADTIDEIERAQAEIHERWFTRPSTVDQPFDDNIGTSSVSLLSTYQEDISIWPNAKQTNLSTYQEDMSIWPSAKQTNLSTNQEEISNWPSAKQTNLSGKQVAVESNMQDEIEYTTDELSRQIAHDAELICRQLTRCTARDDVISPHVLAEVLAGRAAAFKARQDRDAVLLGIGDERDVLFDPIVVVEGITEAVIDDMIQKHVEEMLNVCDHCASGLFAAEFEFT